MKSKFYSFITAIIISGCSDSDVSTASLTELRPDETVDISITVAELPSGDDLIEATRYSPSDTIVNEGEITPEDAIEKAKLVADKFCGDYVDLDTAHLQFHNKDKWFINFEKGLVQGIVGINKKTGEATLEPSD